MKLLAPAVLILRWLSLYRLGLIGGSHGTHFDGRHFSWEPMWRTRAVVLALVVGIVLGVVGVSVVRAGLEGTGVEPSEGGSSGSLTGALGSSAHLSSLAPTAAVIPSVQRWAEPTPRASSTPVVAVVVRKRAVVPASAPSWHSVSLTWYCGKVCTAGYGPSCYCAAASPDLASWRGRLVTVCSGGVCAAHPVLIVDCSCQAHRSLDLYAVVFDDLAPLSRGRIEGAAWQR